MPPTSRAALFDAYGTLFDVHSVGGLAGQLFPGHGQALGEQATGLKAPDIGFVSCNGWDALAASWYGYCTLWINRCQRPFETLGTSPTYTGSNLRDVLILLMNNTLPLAESRTR